MLQASGLDNLGRAEWGMPTPITLACQSNPRFGLGLSTQSLNRTYAVLSLGCSRLKAAKLCGMVGEVCTGCGHGQDMLFAIAWGVLRVILAVFLAESLDFGLAGARLCVMQPL